MLFVLISNFIADMEALSLRLTQAFPGCKCLQFTDAMLSLKYILNNAVDLVMMAERMQPVNSMDLLRNIRRNMAELPVLIIAQDDDMRERAKKLAADGYWKKPISDEQIESIRSISLNGSIPQKSEV